MWSKLQVSTDAIEESRGWSSADFVDGFMQGTKVALFVTGRLSYLLPFVTSGREREGGRWMGLPFFLFQIARLIRDLNFFITCRDSNWDWENGRCANDWGCVRYGEFLKRS